MKKLTAKRVLRGIALRLKFYFFDIPRAKINKWKFNRLKKKFDKIREQEKLPPYERGVYYSHKVGRFILRNISFLVNSPMIIKNKDCRILVIVHLFYMKSVDEILEYLKNLKGYKYDLVITYIDGMYNQSDLDKIAKFKPETEFRKCDNRGYDIGPFVGVINETDLKEYDIVIKMQSKSTGKIAFIYGQFFKNRDWFKNLWNGVLGSFSVHRTISKLYNGKKYGIVAAKNLIIHDPEHKQDLTKEIITKHKLDYVDNYYFVAGSCFAIRSKCLEKIKKAKIKASDFEETTGGFFSLAHAIERAICFSIMPRYRFYGNKVDFWRHLKWGRAEKKLNEISGIKVIKKIKGYDIPSDYLWHSVEHCFLKDASVEEIEINKLRRKHPKTGKIIKLEECEPYLYLEGGEKNRKLYEEYCKYHLKNGLPNMSIARFDKLINSIKKNGYNEKIPIVIGDQNIIYDGQHRACILMHLYGKDYKLKVVKLESVDIDPTKIKAFSKKVPTANLK